LKKQYTEDTIKQVRDLNSKYKDLSNKLKEIEKIPKDQMLDKAAKIQELLNQRNELYSRATKLMNDKYYYQVDESTINSIKDELKDSLNKKFDNIEDLQKYLDEKKKDIVNNNRGYKKYLYLKNEVMKYIGEINQANGQLNNAIKSRDKNKIEKAQLNLDAVKNKNQGLIADLNKEIQDIYNTIPIAFLEW
jgi:chromosome segregation ATPase